MARQAHPIPSLKVNLCHPSATKMSTKGPLEERFHTSYLPPAYNRNSGASKTSTIASINKVRMSVEPHRTRFPIDQVSVTPSSNDGKATDKKKSRATNELIGSLSAGVRAVMHFRRRTEELNGENTMPEVQDDTSVVLQLDDYGPSCKEIEEMDSLRFASSKNSEEENEVICKTLLRYVRCVSVSRSFLHI